MDRIQRDKNSPLCMLEHEMLSKLSVIIGSCDLALEQMKADNTPEPQVERRVTVVREMAWELVAQVREHGCELDRTTRKVLLAELSRKPHRVQGDAGLAVAVDKKVDPLEAPH